ALLAEMLRRAAVHGATTLWVDGRACARSPAGLLDYLRATLPVPATALRGSDDPLARLEAAASGGRRVVLGIDNYDDLSMLEGWLREAFLGQLPDQGILVVLAAR